MGETPATLRNPAELDKEGEYAMPCVHLKKLYELCQLHDLRLSSADLIHIVCSQCGVVEVCPSVYADRFDHEHQNLAPEEDANEIKAVNEPPR
jgi:hypothetical protein